MVGRAALALFTAALLAGCAGDAPGAAQLPGGDTPCVAPAECPALDLSALTADNVVPAPVRAQGDWWELKTSFEGGEDPAFKVINVAAKGTVLATDDPLMAKSEAAYDTPMLGPFGDDLSHEAWGGRWDLFEFPLRDGDTWTATVPNIAWDVIPSEQVELTMSASFDASLPAGDGTAPGFSMMGMTSAGQHVLEVDYVPAVGWFSRLELFDIDPGQEALEVGWQVLDYGHNYTGTYLQHEANELLELFDGAGFDAPPPEGQPFVEPAPFATFLVSADATSLFGFMYIEAAVGGRTIVLSPPGNGQPRHYEAHGDLDGGWGEWTLDEPAVPGEWRVATAGAGGYTVAVLHIFEVMENEFTL